MNEKQEVESSFSPIYINPINSIGKPLPASELVHFEKGKDTHNAYDSSVGKYTIVSSGRYTVVKDYSAGDIIDSPILVTNKKD